MAIIIGICIVTTLVLLIWIKLKKGRAAISILIGLVTGVLSFIAFILLALGYPAQNSIHGPLIVVSYVSLVAFLVLWNIIKTKKVYFILAVPGICIMAITAVIWHADYVRQIPTVSEENYEYMYTPFKETSKAAKLDEEPNFKFTIYDNLPVLDGATALYPVYVAFAQAVYPKIDYPEINRLVLCSKTPRAYENLLQGKADIIFCAGPSDSQREQFIEKGLNLKLVPIGREAFVFFVNKKNIVVNNVTIENIQGIYSGKVKNWKELNGANQKIRAFQRPKNSGSQTMLEKIMGGIPIMEARREDISEGMGGIINQVAVYRNFPDAIGYSFLFFSTEMVKNNHIKLLSIEGVYPSRETIQNGTYPFSNDFYAIYIDSEDKNENIDLFIKWILSEQGQYLIEKTGYTPIKNR